MLADTWLWILRSLDQDVSDGFLSGIAKLVERSVNRLIRRDFGLANPLPVGVQIQVILRFYTFVEVGKV